MNNDKYKQYSDNLDINEEIIEAMVRTLKLKDLSWPFGITKDFEEKIGKFLDVRYSLAHCNGTSAMYSAMFGVGVGKDTEVICPTYTFWASIAPAINLGAKVVFCDINKDDLLIDVNSIHKYITNQTRAIIVPHLWGRFGDINKLKSVCKKYKHKIAIIEDASHCFGAKYKNKFLGTLGDVGIYSLQAGKPLVAGEGGLLVTNNVNIYNSAIYLGHYERIKFLSNSQYSNYVKTGGGYKFRIHPLAAALALSQLKNIKDKLKKHNLLMGYYEDRLRDIPQLQTFDKNYKDFEPGGHFGLRVAIKLTGQAKSKFINECNKNGIKIEDEYLPLLHQEKFFIQNEAKNISINTFKDTEELYKHLISLPLFYKGNKLIIDSFLDDFLEILQKYQSK